MRTPADFETGGRPPSVALARELEEVRKQIDALQSELSLTPESGLGEGDPSIARWEMAHTILDQLMEREMQLEVTSAPSAEYDYGLCAECGRAIHADRLAVLPGARLCIRCARNLAGEQGGASRRNVGGQ